MGRKPQQKKPAQVGPQPKGVAIEEGLRLYFSSLGFFALRALPFRLEGEDVTDIDLWLYERPASSSRRRSIVDIRNKKSPQAAERLIWTKGLQSALGMDSAFVATTDRRAATHRLARSLKIGLIESEPFQKIIDAFAAQNVLSTQAEFDHIVREADAARHTTEWRDAVSALKGSLLTGIGFPSANRGLNILGHVYEEAILAPAASPRALAAGRVSYFAAACTAISLDFALAEYTFRSREERSRVLENGLRYGGPDASTSLAKIRTASSLIEKYLPNGRHLSKSVESSFLAEAEQIPARIIAEHITRTSQNDALFEPARMLLDAALSKEPVAFDALPVGAKSLLSVFIDFLGGSREKFAKLWLGVPEGSLQPGKNGELPLAPK